MALSSDLYVGELLMRLVGHQTGEISKVDYKPQKPAFYKEPQEGETFLERATPESQGVSSRWVKDLFEALHECPKANMHKIMVMRHGKVIGETAFAPYDLDYWHIVHSLSKSVTGMAIGILIGEGKLNITDKLIDLLPDKKTLNSMLRLRDVTIEHLLSMTSGVQFNEAGAISGNDWVKGFMDSGTSFAPGKEFSYNSMNSYMLSAVVTAITGQSLFDFVKERIFDPMGIKRVFWEACPKGITKGGWGLFLRIEDMCKLGQLYLQKGMWEGKQLVPEGWVVASTTKHATTDIPDAPGYGYHLWLLNSREGSYIFNGMLGQNVYIFPDIDMVLAVNAGNNEVFQTGAMTDILYEKMRDIEVSDEPLSEDLMTSRFLDKTIDRIMEKEVPGKLILRGGWNRRSDAYDNQQDKIMRIRTLYGSYYDLGDSGIGIFPLMMQITHNNFTDGITKIGFVPVDRKRFGVQIYEGDQIYTLLCGADMYENKVSFNIHGEVYDAVVKTRLSTDEYNRMAIMLRIFFLEETSERRINIYLGSKYDQEDTRGFRGSNIPDGIDVHFNEYPGNNLLSGALSTITSSKGIQGMIMNKLDEFGASFLVGKTIHYTINPRVHGFLIKEDDNGVVGSDDNKDDIKKDNEEIVNININVGDSDKSSGVKGIVVKDTADKDIADKNTTNKDS